MDLLSGQPYWLLKNGFIRSYPRLSADVSTDVLVIGGGITGALIAWRLARDGHRVVVVDRRHIGMGSTAGSTALLQYEIDTPLWELCERVGDADAVASYRLCVAAIDRLEVIARAVGNTSFQRRPSLYYASRKRDVPDLAREYALREKHGLPAEWWDADRLDRHFPLLGRKAALWNTANAEVDAFAFCHDLLHDAQRHGAMVCDGTEVTGLAHHARSVEACTADGRRIRARRLVVACGYESQQYLSQPVVTLHSTYSVISEPVGPDPSAPVWFENCLIWESARPYMYARSCDGRVLAGGKDDPFYSPARRDRSLARKTKQIAGFIERRLTGRPTPVDFAWAGTFAETADGLPFLGTVPERPHTWFAMGMGGNGIVFSSIAADAIGAVFAGDKKKPEAIRLFRFGR